MRGAGHINPFVLAIGTVLTGFSQSPWTRRATRPARAKSETLSNQVDEFAGGKGPSRRRLLTTLRQSATGASEMRACTGTAEVPGMRFMPTRMSGSRQGPGTASILFSSQREPRWLSPQPAVEYRPLSILRPIYRHPQLSTSKRKSPACCRSLYRDSSQRRDAIPPLRALAQLSLAGNVEWKCSSCSHYVLSPARLDAYLHVPSQYIETGPRT
jgi:hypothetical protein